MIKEPTEDQLHKAVAEALMYQNLSCMWWHTPNGGSRNTAEAAKLKAMGVKAGVADFAFAGCKHVRIGFIELKRKSGRMEQSQKDFRDECEAHGIPYEVVKTSDTNEMIAKVLGILKVWGAL